MSKRRNGELHIILGNPGAGKSPITQALQTARISRLKLVLDIGGAKKPRGISQIYSPG